MSFRLTGLHPGPFAGFFRMTDTELARHGARRCIVDAKPGFPDRVELRDLEIGETALLVNYTHQPADTPYRASHAVYVGENSRTAYDAVDRVPETLRLRPLSLRAFDAEHMLHDAVVVDGREVESALELLLADERAAYIHVHYARAGCYAARVERA
jgi:hypothetical protein